MNIEATDLRVYKTRRNIKETLISLLSEKPLKSITVTELSKKAMINRKTFYRHYKTVNDVVNDIENEMVDSLMEMIVEKDISCLDATAVLSQIGLFIELNKESLKSITRLTPDILNQGKLEDMLRHTIKITLKKSANCGEKELDYVTAFTVAGLMALYADWINNGCADDINLLTKCAERLIAKGLSFYLSESDMSMFSGINESLQAN